MTGAHSDGGSEGIDRGSEGGGDGRHRGFEPVARTDARVLVLGSLPGAQSLRLRQYYAQPRNGFWTIMGDLAGATPDLPYSARLDRLRDAGIALWDVCATAERIGSLDAAIRAAEPNDFAHFLAAHPALRTILFNGRTAEALFTRLVRPRIAGLIDGETTRLTCITLPSTSPAHARLRPDAKLALWRDALGRASGD